MFSPNSKRTPLQSAAEIISTAWSQGLAPPPKQTVSQWADENRYLSRESSPEEGRWRTARAPYQRDPMDAVNDPDTEVLVLKWASQLGKSEVINNILGYFIHHDPAPILFVLPTLEMADDYSQNRIRALIDESPALRELIGGPAKSRSSKDTIRLKKFAGGYLAFAGANSPASLASRPIRIVLMDEIDKFARAIGKDGDPIKQAFQRTVNFWNAKKIVSSTPTIKGLSQVDEWYKKSDQRRYLVPCKSCGEHQPLEWKPGETVIWHENRPDSAEYCCATCGEVWSQHDLRQAVRNGYWKAQKEFTGIAGFHLSALASPWQTLAELVSEYEDTKDDIETEQTFINLKLGECYEPSMKPAAAPEELKNRSEDFSLEAIPPRVMLLTMGVDVQGDRLEYQILGHGAGEELWVLENQIIAGDPQTEEPWEALNQIIAKRFLHPSGQPIMIEAVAVDSGFRTQTVMEYCARHQAMGRKVYAIKGVVGTGQPIWRQSEQVFKARKKLFLVGTHDAKMAIYWSLAKATPGDGYTHFAGHLSLDFYKQLLAEEIAIKKTGGAYVQVFENPKKKRNEAFDMMVYAKAARFSLRINYADRLRHFSQCPKKKPRRNAADIAKLFKK